MNGEPDLTPYTMLAYAVSVALLWGYALRLWLLARALRRREGDDS
jgi:hypothetical protein